MKNLYINLLLAISVLAAAGTAFAQVPSTNDTSDTTLFNTGGGTGAINPATTGNDNTAYGYAALTINKSGEGNSAFGTSSLQANTDGIDNAGFGAGALEHNTTGQDNTAAGYGALAGNTTAQSNTGVGAYALFDNSVGVSNTAVGSLALESSIANDNTALGADALHVNRGGGGNTASGYGALASNTSGHYNIANGYRAGYNLTTGSYNIAIGHVGVKAESGVIRIGTAGQQTQAFIAGIANNSSVSGPYVVINSTTGQLGVSTTSAPAAVKTAYVPRLLREIQQQAAEIRGLKEQVEQLNAFNEATRIALQRLQVKDELMAQR
jgi:trimeric autotransporter adhesin